MANYYHTRVSPAKVNPSHDFNVFMSEIISKREGLWDKDKKNQICIGDYLGFITGPNGNELVYIFRVQKELPTIMRHNHWANNTPYTKGNGSDPVCHRQVIQLTNNHPLPQTITWKEFRNTTGLGGDCAHWMPRGTQIIKDKNKLPFKHLMD